MADLINREKNRENFMDIVYEQLESDPDNFRANQIIDAFDSLLAVDAAPVVHGRWIILLNDKKSGCDIYGCSECKNAVSIVKPSWQFCPNCGAKMDGEDN